MTERKARIDFTNLPLRPRQLKPEELHNVFGGCYGQFNVCLTDSECCAPTKCRFTYSQTYNVTNPIQMCQYTDGRVHYS